MATKARTLVWVGALATIAALQPARAGVVNGDFESGDAGFSSGYTSVTAGVNQGSCYPAATYAVVGSPNECHNFWADYAPHSGDLQLVANGAGDATIAVWTETVSVIPGTDYGFDAWAASSYPQSPALLHFTINGVGVGDLLLGSNVGVWTLFNSSIWSSGVNTLATLAIYDSNTEPSGNDFSLDDISFESIGPTQVPEPLTLSLICTGLLAAGVLRLRKKKAA